MAACVARQGGLFGDPRRYCVQQLVSSLACSPRYDDEVVSLQAFLLAEVKDAKLRKAK